MSDTDLIEVIEDMSKGTNVKVRLQDDGIWVEADDLAFGVGMRIPFDTAAQASEEFQKAAVYYKDSIIDMEGKYNAEAISPFESVTMFAVEGVEVDDIDDLEDDFISPEELAQMLADAVPVENFYADFITHLRPLLVYFATADKRKALESALDDSTALSLELNEEHEFLKLTVHKNRDLSEDFEFNILFERAMFLTEELTDFFCQYCFVDGETKERIPFDNLYIETGSMLNIVIGSKAVMDRTSTAPPFVFKEIHKYYQSGE